MDKTFLKAMFDEVADWTRQGIITAKQQARIRALYDEQPAVTPIAEPPPPARAARPVRATGVLIGAAALFLVVGIFLFYAANWRLMPTALKLAQVFVLLVGSYTLAARFLRAGSPHPALGRALSLVGMASFGAAIMLVAQVYHVSARPAEGLLAWAIGVFAMSWLLRERIGLYAAQALAFVWVCWLTAAGEPGWGYLLALAAGGAAFRQLRDKVGLYLVMALALVWCLVSAGQGLPTWPALLLLAAGAALFRHQRDWTGFHFVQALALGWYLIQVYQGQPAWIYLPILAVAGAVYWRARDWNGLLLLQVFACAWFLVETRLGQPVWAYLPVLAALGAVLWQGRRPLDLALVLAQGIVFFYHALIVAGAPTGGPSAPFLILCCSLPFGALLVAGGEVMRRHDLLVTSGGLARALGYAVFLGSLLALSWPLAGDKPGTLASFSVSPVHSAACLACLALAGGLLAALRRQGFAPLALFAIALLLFVLPAGDDTTRLVVAHLALPALMFLLPVLAPREEGKKSPERHIAELFLYAALSVKAIGLLTLAANQPGHRILFLAGFLLFAAACLLANLLAEKRCARTDKPWDASPGTALAMTLAWLVVFVTSFKGSAQAGLSMADPALQALLAMFLVLAAALYAVAYRTLPGRRALVNLAGGLALGAAGMIALAGPPASPDAVVVFANLLLLALSVYFAWYAAVIQSRQLLRLAIVAFVTQAVVRYFDVLWDLLSGAALFIVTGLLGLVIGWFIERRRRAIVQSFAKDGKDGSRT